MIRKYKCKEIKDFNISQGGFCASDNISCLSGSLLTNTYYFSCVMELYTCQINECLSSEFYCS